MIRREFDTNDRRKTIIVLTENHFAMMSQGCGFYRNTIDALIENLEPEEIASLYSVLTKANKILADYNSQGESRMKKMFGYLRFYWWQVIVILGLVYIQTMADLTLPDYMSKIIDTGILKKDINYIYSTGGKMLLIALGVMASAIIVSLLSAQLGSSLANRVRKDLFSKVENFSLIEFDRFSPASLITRNSNDVNQVPNADHDDVQNYDLSTNLCDRRCHQSQQLECRHVMDLRIGDSVTGHRIDHDLLLRNAAFRTSSKTCR